MAGLGASLRRPRSAQLAVELASIAPADRGFAYEGAAMGLGLLDALPWRTPVLWRSFCRSEGAPHLYLLHVGLGWAVARLPYRRGTLLRLLAALDPRLRWLVVDGLGFHEALFRTRETVTRARLPRKLPSVGTGPFDQGIGRCLWFIAGCRAQRAAELVDRFPKARRNDLWAGLGLAAAYAGGTSREGLVRLLHLAREAGGRVAQGVAFAAEARSLAQNPAPHTELACQLTWGASAPEVASVVAEELRAARRSVGEDCYAAWRGLVTSRYESPEVVV